VSNHRLRELYEKHGTEIIQALIKGLMHSKSHSLQAIETFLELADHHFMSAFEEEGGVEVLQYMQEDDKVSEILHRFWLQTEEETEITVNYH